MLNIIYASLWLFALWKWGDWRNWKVYYPTFLFFIIGDFLYLYLLSDAYPMWRYNPPPIDRDMGITNSHVSLSIMAIKYPATVLIYLSNFPDQNKLSQILYVVGWVVIYAVNELVDLHLGVIQYFNDWNFWWSCLFNVIVFTLLRVHIKNPLLAWVYSIGVVITLWNIFNVPDTVFR
ncbi:CBO0543 family protein [Bacillus sp. AK128]